jgi:DNA-binding MarR family transcriptional regulator
MIQKRMPSRPPKTPPATSSRALGKSDYERLSDFRYRLRQFLRASEHTCRTHGLTALQYQLLLHVAGFPGRAWATIGELAERLQAQHHGVVALVDRCAALGLLERRPGRADGRVVEIHLLPKGERLLAEVAGLHRDELHRLLGEFSPAMSDRGAP